jgi:hypothetical protein
VQRTAGHTVVTVALAALVVLVPGPGAGVSATPPDRLPPTKPTIDGQLAPTVLRPTFTFGATDRRTPRGKMRFRCAFDGAALRPCARIHRPVGALSFGEHTLRVRALDLAGNMSRTASFSFQVVGSWDAARDFERAPRPANPGRDQYGNAAWSYRYSSQGRSHDPATYELLPTFAVLAPNWEVWLLAPDFQSASTGFNNGQIILHPAPSHLGHNAILAWRSPVNATVRLQAAVYRLHLDCPVPANGVVWSLDHGNRTLRTGTLVDGSAENFELSLTVTAGESVYLVVGDNGDSNCDSTGARLSIETT